MANTCITSVCPVCSTAFAPQYRWSVYCATECAKQARRQRALAKLRERGDVWAKAQAYKREARQLKAERDGREFRPGLPGRPPGYAAPKPPPTAEQEARKAWRGWVKRAPPWWKAAAQKARDGLRTISGGGDAEVLRSRWRKHRHERRAATRSAMSDGTLTPFWLKRLFEILKDCAYCGVAVHSANGRRYSATMATLDHVSPLNRGGQHSITNAIVCCANCNYSKSDATIDQWCTRTGRDAIAVTARLEQARQVLWDNGF